MIVSASASATGGPLQRFANVRAQNTGAQLNFGLDLWLVSRGGHVP